MGFKQITRIPVGADLSAFAGCSGIPLNLWNCIIGPPCPIDYQVKNVQSIIDLSALLLSSWLSAKR